MNLDGILGVPHEIFQDKVLLEPFKHKFYLPAVYVGLGDLVSGQLVIVGQENLG
ncbi:hypothetical protein BH23BAC3_BH23BAC3_22630 [soil metagenome]